MPRVVFFRHPDRLILVGVHQRADPLVREHLGEQPSSTPPSMMCTRGTPPRRARAALVSLEKVECSARSCSCAGCFRLLDGQLTEQAARRRFARRLQEDAGRRRQVDRLTACKARATSTATVSEFRR